jgi:hypothetical protein
VLFRKQNAPKQPATYPKQILSLVPFIELARNYFPSTAVMEVYEEFIPQIAVAAMSETIISLAMFNLFMPTKFVTRALVDSIFTIWKEFVHSPALDAMIMDWLARIGEEFPAEYNPMQPDLMGWKTDTELPMIYTCGMRMLDLPVGSSDSGATGGHGKGHAVRVELGGIPLQILGKKKHFTRMRVLARLLIATLHLPSAFERLSNFIRAIESFSHPSNRGTWANDIAKLLRGLSTEFVARLSDHRKPAPKQFKDLVRPFVTLVKAPVFAFMYSKDSSAMIASQGALRNLVGLDPEVMMPSLLADHIYPALGGFSDVASDGSHVHRTLAAINALGACVAPLVHSRIFPPGPQTHIVELLFLVLPGIDVNDHNKTIATLLFIARTMFVFRFDDTKKFPNAQGVVGEDWVTQFVDRVLCLLEGTDSVGMLDGSEQHASAASNSSNSSSGRGIESNMLQAMQFASHVTLDGLPKELIQVAFSRVFQWIRGKSLANTSNSFSKFFVSIIRQDPDAFLHRVLEWIDEKITEEIAHGAGSRKTLLSSGTSLDHGTATLLQYQRLIWELARVPSTLWSQPESPCRHLILQILHKLLPLDDRKSFSMTHSTILTLLSTLTTVYSLKCAIKSDVDTSMLLFPKPDEVFHYWHIPNPCEISLAMELVSSYSDGIEQSIGSLVSAGGNKFDFNSQHQWLRQLSLLNACIRATSFWKHEHVKREKLVTARANIDCSKLRERYGSLLLQSWKIFNALPETGTEVDLKKEQQQQPPHMTIFPILISATRAYLALFGTSPGQGDGLHGELKVLKSMTRIPPGASYGSELPLLTSNEGITSEFRCRGIGLCNFTNKSYPLMIHTRRVNMLHERRMKLLTSNFPVSKVDEFLVECLENAATMVYPTVRRAGHSALLSVLAVRTSQKKPTTLRLLKKFGSFANDVAIQSYSNGTTAPVLEDISENLKSILRLFHSKILLRTMLANPEMFWPYLISQLIFCQTQDKPAIQQLLQLSLIEFVVLQLGFQFHPHISAQVKELSQGWLNEGFQLSNSEARLDKLLKKKESYQYALDSLVDFIQSGGSHVAPFLPGSNQVLKLSTSLHWRTCGTALSMICGLLLVPEMKVSSKLMGVVLQRIVDEHYNLRTIADGTLQSILSIVKDRSLRTSRKIKIPCTPEIQKSLRNGDLVDCVLKSTALVGPLKNCYIDNANIGWLCFAKEIPVYSSTKFGSPIPLSADWQSCVNTLQATMTAPDFVTKIFHYHSLESNNNRQQSLNFSWNRACLIKQIVSLLGPGSYVEVALARVVEMMDSPHDQPAKIKCGLEWAAGILCGLKHWPTNSANEVWNVLLPPLERGMEKCVNETLKLYDSLLRYVLQRRDPRRVAPLFNLILKSSSNAGDSKSGAFAEAKKLSFLKTVVDTIGQYSPTFLQQLIVNQMFPLVCHPLKLVRDSLGSLIWEALFTLHRYGYGSVSDFLALHAEGSQQKPNRQNLIVISKLATDVCQKILQANNPDDKLQGIKTIAVLLVLSINHYRAQPLYVILKPLLHLVLKLVSSEDVEASDIGKQCVSAAAHFNLGTQDRAMDHIRYLLSLLHAKDRPISPVEGLSQLSSEHSDSWQIKIQIIRVVQIVYFRHLLVFNMINRDEIVDMLFGLLLDPQLEVRILAGVSISGILQCSGSSPSLNPGSPQSPRITLRERVRLLATRLLKEGPGKSLPQRVRGKSLPSGYADAVRCRHGGVISLCSIIRAAPYSVPKGIPEILVQLASYSSDPAPITTTIRDTFAEFKRTHSDTWHIDRLAFEPEQLSMLSDIFVSPSYYA